MTADERPCDNDCDDCTPPRFQVSITPNLDWGRRVHIYDRRKQRRYHAYAGSESAARDKAQGMIKSILDREAQTVVYDTDG